jgi:hypothetical protein
MVETSALIGATRASVFRRASSGRGNEARPQSVGVPDRAALTFRSSRGPNSSPAWKAAVGDTPPALRSFDVMALGNEELGLPGFPRAPLLHAGWGQVVG